MSVEWAPIGSHQRRKRFQYAMLFAVGVAVVAGFNWIVWPMPIWVTAPLLVITVPLTAWLVGRQVAFELAGFLRGMPVRVVVEIEPGAIQVAFEDGELAIATEDARIRVLDSDERSPLGFVDTVQICTSDCTIRIPLSDFGFPLVRSCRERGIPVEWVEYAPPWPLGLG